VTAQPTVTSLPNTRQAEKAVRPGLAPSTWTSHRNRPGKRGYRISRAQGAFGIARLNLATVAWQVRSQLRVGALRFRGSRAAAQHCSSPSVKLEQQTLKSAVNNAAGRCGADRRWRQQRIAMLKASTGLAEARPRRTAEAAHKSPKHSDFHCGTERRRARPPDLGCSSDPGSRLGVYEFRQQALQHRTDLLAALAEYAASSRRFNSKIARQIRTSPRVGLSV